MSHSLKLLNLTFNYSFYDVLIATCISLSQDLDRSQLENKMKYSRELLELADVLDPGLSLLRGSILFELQAGIVALAKFLLSNDIISSSGAKVSKSV